MFKAHYNFTVLNMANEPIRNVLLDPMQNSESGEGSDAVPKCSILHLIHKNERLGSLYIYEI